MKFLGALIFVSLFFSSAAQANFGVSGGVGLPFLGQVGVDYKASSNLSFYVGYNMLSIDVDSASAELTMPEFLVRYHPFSESFFVGVGLGYETLDVSATDALTGQTARAEVSALTGIVKAGWMWGAADNQGFWFGIDVAYISPFSPDVTITAPGVLTTSEEYQDVVDAAEQFGETAFPNLTFIRLGYIF